MRKVITNEVGAIKLGDTLLPGIFETIEVDGRLRIDEKEVPGQSGKSKQPLGFEDAKIRMTLKLLTDEQSDCYEKAAVIIRLFQTVDKQAKPYVYSITNRLLALWNITEVLFEDIKTSDAKGADTLMMDMSFTEYKPAIVAAEAKAVSSAGITSAVDLSSVLGGGTENLAKFEEGASYLGKEEFAAVQKGTPAEDDDMGV